MGAVDPQFWNGRRVLVTGHTGFKGSWLTLWLDRLGARVTGFALPPDTRDGVFGHCLDGRMASVIGDVTDRDALAHAVADAAPEIVIHMAAQALVRPSYADPVGTFATNVIGTVNLLQICRSTPGLRALLVVTSDKVYENREEGQSFREDDPLGGHDPYSASKACAEIVTASFRRSYFTQGARIASVRAGNVIGGGDWSADRIVPDLVRALAQGEPVALRYPHSVRPWQHVLDPLSGYLAFAQALAMSRADLPGALNFAPDASSFRSVAGLAEAFAARYGADTAWRKAEGTHPHEAGHLTLDAAEARRVLGWDPVLDFDEAVGWTADWYAAHARGDDMRAMTLDQIGAYMTRDTSGRRCSKRDNVELRGP